VSEEEGRLRLNYLIYAILSGMVNGLITAINSLSLKYFVKDCGFPVQQLSMDSNLIFGLLLLPFLLVSQIKM